jgi:hypothetical protein
MLLVMFDVFARACSREREGDMCAGAMHFLAAKTLTKITTAGQGTTLRPPSRAQLMMRSRRQLPRS